jgi:hypothetical protein
MRGAFLAAQNESPGLETAFGDRKSEPRRRIAREPLETKKI